MECYDGIFDEASLQEGRDIMGIMLTGDSLLMLWLEASQVLSSSRVIWIIKTEAVLVLRFLQTILHFNQGSAMLDLEGFWHNPYCPQ